MPDPGPTAAATPAAAPANTVDLDDVSLRQALLDFEVANARVLDLSGRLTQLNRQLLESNTSLHRARARNRRLQSELDAIRGSTSYRSVVKAAGVVRAAKSRLGK